MRGKGRKYENSSTISKNQTNKKNELLKVVLWLPHERCGSRLSSSHQTSERIKEQQMSQDLLSKKGAGRDDSQQREVKTQRKTEKATHHSVV